jgi:hypothetical protein
MSDISAFPDFVPLALEHKETLNSLLAAHPPEISEHTFTNLFMWRNYYAFELSRFEEGILCLAKPQDGEPFFLQPLGFDDILPAFHACLSYLETRGWNTGVHRVARSVVQAFIIRDSSLIAAPDRDQFDYVYRTKDLIDLSGRKYHRKKNHVNQFRKRYSFEYRPITKDLMEDCFKLIEEWCLIRHCEEFPTLEGEEQAIREALLNMDTLSFRAGGLLVEGKLEAFALGEPLNSTEAVIHIEKANADIQGIYAAMNQQFCEHEWSNFEFINREQDLGEEGLRKAKESYLPHHYVEKYNVTLK